MIALLIGFDWNGAAALVAAFTAMLTVILQYLARRPAAEVHAAVSTPPDAPPLGQMVADHIYGEEHPAA